MYTHRKGACDGASALSFIGRLTQWLEYEAVNFGVLGSNPRVTAIQNKIILAMFKKLSDPELAAIN